MRKSRAHLLLIVAGLVAGSWSCCSTRVPSSSGGRPFTDPSCPLEERNHAIWVFEDGNVTEEGARISKMKNHKIIWLSTNGADLRIDLVLPKGRVIPFENMKCEAADPNTGESVCHIDCKKDRCQTGKFAENYHPSALGDS